MFQLMKEEYEGLRFQIESLENQHPLRLQNETLKSSRIQKIKSYRKQRTPWYTRGFPTCCPTWIIPRTCTSWRGLIHPALHYPSDHARPGPGWFCFPVRSPEQARLTPRKTKPRSEAARSLVAQPGLLHALTIIYLWSKCKTKCKTIEPLFSAPFTDNK